MRMRRMPDVVGLIHAYSELSHLRRAPKGRERLPHFLPLPKPDVLESSDCCPGLSHLHHARGLSGSIPNFPRRTLDAVESSHCCPGPSRPRRAGQESERPLQIPYATPDAMGSTHAYSGLLHPRRVPQGSEWLPLFEAVMKISHLSCS